MEALLEGMKGVNVCCGPAWRSAADAMRVSRDSASTT